MESFGDLFEIVKQYCKEKISPTAYELWIMCLEPKTIEGNVATLYVKTPFQRDIIKEKYISILSKAFENTLGFPIEIDIISDKEPQKINYEFTEIKNTNQNQEYKQNVDIDDGGEYEYKFETFIVGSSNKFAHAASLAVASNPSGAYNPLFIYGQSGLGKTHLLYAIAHEINKEKPNKKVLYSRGEEFTNELIQAIGANTTANFRTKYRQIDVLLIDDIQFIAGKVQTQEEFFYTFNDLYEAGKQIVLTSDRPPKEIKTLEDRLLTRFESGLLADVSTPDFETRIAIIRRKAELLNIDIPNEVAEFIANKLKNNIRQLEGAVKNLKAKKLLTGANPSIMVAQDAIRDIIGIQTPTPVTVERIIREVSRTYTVNEEDIRSNKRSQPISQARQVAIYVVREITQMSMTNIGAEFGGRDHSTIVYALQQVEKTMKIDRKYKEIIEDIIKNIKER